MGERSQRRGIKSKMAKTLRCQPTYISQILYGSANLSLEQAETLNGFLEHAKDESDFFLLLVQHDRAGSKRLKAYFEEKIEECLKSRLKLTTRLGGTNELTELEKSKYYSSWRYAALHIGVTVPALQTREALSHFFRLPLPVVTETLTFLVSCGLIEEREGRFKAVIEFVRLGNESHNIIKHHTNWRTQAIDSLDREEISDLHYSGVLSVSEKDAIVLKNKFLEFIAENASLVQKSNSETVYAMCLDLFQLKR